MTRLEKFESFKDHIIQSKLYNKLTARERGLCVEFLRENEDLGPNEFLAKVNRWMLDVPKPKNFTMMWALVIQSVNARELVDEFISDFKEKKK